MIVNKENGARLYGWEVMREVEIEDKCRKIEKKEKYMWNR